MSTSLFVQYVILGVIVLAAAWVVLRKLAPQLTSRWLAGLSLRLDRAGRPRWLRVLGHRLQPAQGTGDCADGCSTCGACGGAPPAAAQPDVVPLNFRPRPRRG